MTTIYFVRHAEPNYENHDDLERELSHKGLRDRALVTQFLSDKGISVVLSSPYKRAVDTVSEFAELKKINIVTIDDFRERRVDSEWIPDFDAFCQKQWRIFSTSLRMEKAFPKSRNEILLPYNPCWKRIKGRIS